MIPIQSTVSTKGLHRADRFDFWREIVCRNLLEGDCEPVAPSDFFGELVVTQTAHVTFGKIRSVAQRFERTERHLGSGDPALVLGLQLRGNSVVRQDGREAALSPGGFVFLDTARPWSVQTMGGFEQMAMYLPRDALPAALWRTRDFAGRAYRADTELTGLVVPYLAAMPGMLQRLDAPAAERLAGIAVSLAVSAIDQILSNGMPDANWSHAAQLQRAKTYIGTHAAETTLTPPVVAEGLGISLRTLQALFADENDTPSDFIWRCRLKRARAALLSERVASIGTVALVSGFSDFAHFSRRFKKEFGMTPGEYRRTKQG